jgi:fatty-acyl-CoA synthase
MALVVLRASHAASVTEQDIRVHVQGFSEKGLISKYAVPQTVRFIDAIDKTSVGKCDKKTLRKKYC